jgi:alpha-tubulin suppressor-like RCC1 family protein
VCWYSHRRRLAALSSKLCTLLCCRMVQGWERSIVKQAHFAVVLLLCSLNGEGVTSVSCGRTQARAVTRGGDIYSWGLNGYGQLGTPPLFCAICIGAM